MNRLFKLIFIYFFLILYSCNQNEIKIQSFSEKDFKNVINLNEERKMTIPILAIKDFFIKDSFIFIRNFRNDSIFMILDLNTMKCIKSWGTEGRGPDEYGKFTHIIKLPQDKFLVADFSKLKIQYFTIPEFKLMEEEGIKNNRNEQRIREVPQRILTADGEFFFYDKFINHDLVITKWQNGRSPREIYHFESLKDKFKDKASTTYSGFIGINNKLKRIVYAYRFFRRFDILDYNGKLIKQINITPNISSPMFNNGRNPDFVNSTRSFSQVRTTDNSIFLYYVGYSNSLLKNSELLKETYIEEFNWNGQPLRRFKLNRVISNFDLVSDNDKGIVFIGVDVSHEYPILFFKEEKNEK